MGTLGTLGVEERDEESKLTIWLEHEVDAHPSQDMPLPHGIGQR
jgi:hypothetical protein